jgi:hypothetical protein
MRYEYLQRGLRRLGRKRHLGKKDGIWMTEGREADDRRSGRGR